MCDAISALQILIDNGIDSDRVRGLCDDLIEFDSEDNRALVLLAYLLDDGQTVEPDDVSDESTSYCDHCYRYGGGEYRVFTEDEADEAVHEYIRDCLWAFCPNFLASQTGQPIEVFKALADQCEGANEAIEAIVKSTCGLDDFVNEAVSCDGRGHFLAHYDGEENEISIGGEWFFIYRTN